MRYLLLIIIILLAGLLLVKLPMEDKRGDFSVQSRVRSETSQPAMVRKTEKQTKHSPTKTADKAGRVWENNDMQVLEYNASLSREYNVSKTWNNDTDNSQESNVSQAQRDIVKKRQVARQRRDELLKMRAETIKRLGQGGQH